MSYTDFIGLVNQRNVPPGSFVTLNKWISYSGLSNMSNVLELACTTGFSIREISNLTGCSGLGVDLSKKSIVSARISEEKYGTGNIEYIDDDVFSFSSIKKYSHIVVGAAMKFFGSESVVVEKIVSLLDDGGYLLASPFFVNNSIPQELIQKAKEVFGITITTESYKEVMSIYKGFEILYEDRSDLLEETEDELKFYTDSTIKKFFSEKSIDIQGNESLYKTCFDRLYEIKSMSNELRTYQGYSVLVLRYRKNHYPNRYVELF